MWTIAIYLFAAANFAIGNIVIGSALLVIGTGLSMANQLVEAIDKEDEESTHVRR